MTLANCPDYGVVCKEARHRIHDQWAFKKLGIGPIEDTMHVHVKQKWIVRTVDDDWMDVSLWQYKEENSINMLHNIHGDHPTPGGQDFIVNNDGTISPTEAQWLCLGVEQPRMVLVTRSSPRVLHFSNKPEGIFELTLAGWQSNLGLISPIGAYGKSGEWKYRFGLIGNASQAITARRDENFIRREPDGLALDVSGWRYEEGNEINWVGAETEERTKLRGGGRDFLPDSRAEQGLPYTLISGGSRGFAIGASMDLHLYCLITSLGSMVEVCVNMPSQIKLLNVSENTTLLQLMNMGTEEDQNKETPFKISLIKYDPLN